MEVEVVQQLFGDAQLFNRMSIQESADSCQKAAASACSGRALLVTVSALTQAELALD